MKITLESTSKIVELNGVPARIWEGKTESGIPVHAFITRIVVAKEDDSEEFQKELNQCKAPSAAVNAYPLKMIL
jgi:hypothetical protein